MVDDICFLDATAMAAKIRSRELSAVEVMEAHLAQVERVNPAVNAIVTLVAERAMEGARAADAQLAGGEPVGPLHGLPVAHKDVVATKGIRTTQGSLIYKDFVPDEDALIVERLRAAGAITIGKTNTPEFAAGSQTFNRVFGATLNPYDLSRTCGGSSGGAAVALATGMIPIADGSDLGGSLRNPANFCNVVGFRVSQGRVPVYPAVNGWPQMVVSGPMARTVADVALMLSAIAGPDPRSPSALETPGSSFVRPLGRDFRGARVAWCMRPGGVPVDRRVIAALEGQQHIFSVLDCELEEAGPDFVEADEVFKVLRGWTSAAARWELVRDYPELVKETVKREVEEGQLLSGAEVARAEQARTRLYHRMRTFMEGYDFLALPVSQVPPFPVTQEYPTKIEGVQMETYIDWMQSCYFITVTGHPAISVPCGFTDEGLPVGIQLVGRYRDDFGLLQFAHAFEQATQTGRRRPALVAGRQP